jgi:5-methylcytosine-specific restriction endonuclease McrA
VGVLFVGNYFIQKRQLAMSIHKRFKECQHPQTRLVYQTFSDGSIHYFRQCLTCGQKTTSALSKSSLGLERLSAVPIDQMQLESKSSAWKFYHEKFSHDWWIEYDRYLHTEEWKTRSRAVIKRDRGLCQQRSRGCTIRATEAHHLNYEHVGDEPLKDLIAICHHCHELVTRESRQQWITLE